MKTSGSVAHGRGRRVQLLSDLSGQTSAGPFCASVSPSGDNNTRLFGTCEDAMEKEDKGSFASSRPWQVPPSREQGRWEAQGVSQHREDLYPSPPPPTHALGKLQMVTRLICPRARSRR